MKFLVTGSIRKAEGPRRIIAYSLVLLLMFLLAHGAREIYSTGIWPEQIRTALHGAKDQPARKSPLVVLEDLHVDLLLYSILFLLLGSLLYQMPLGRRLKNVILAGLFLTAVLYASARMATVYFPDVAYITALAFPLFELYHMGVVLLIFVLLYYEPDARKVK